MPARPIFAKYMIKYFFLLTLLLGALCSQAQDSTAPPSTDTAGVPTIRQVARKPMVRRKEKIVPDSTLYFSGKKLPATIDYPSDSAWLTAHPYFHFTDPVRHGISLKQWKGKETIFYSIIALLLLFALIKNGFTRYIQDLFKIFFQTTVNQRQTKEQLTQSPLPSLLLNIFFLLSIGMFLALLLQYFGLGTSLNFWILYLYCIAGLVIIYLMKFISLKMVGWIFQVPDAVDSYIFIVFTTNKVIGMFLLPFLVLLAFTYGFVSEAAMNLSIFMVLALLAYRYFLSYVSIHRTVRIHFFHFILYLCAFEIVPLLLINKLLFRLLGETS